MSREALTAIIGLRASRLLYVSCDVATLARDLHRLIESGYSLSHLEAFDLFPNTAHIESLAQTKGCTSGQLALAWLLAREPFIVPIPGTKRRKYLEENAGAMSVELTADDMKRIDELLPPGAAAGPRYPQAAMASLNR